MPVKKKKEKTEEKVYDKTSESNPHNELEEKLNKKSRFKVYELILIAVAIMVVTAFLTFVITVNVLKSNGTSISSSKKSDDMGELKEVYDLINSSYYKKVDKSKLIDGAINGMLASLDDPHTNYMTKSEKDSFNDIMNGSFEGIGVEITMDNNRNIVIISVFKDSPANEVGLKFNDKIIEVNGKSTEGLTTNDVVALIKDKDKPIAKVKVNRDGKELSFEIQKRIVEIESVESEVFTQSGKKIGYLAINNFANNTYEQFKQELEALEAKNISGLVIDVRDNSGGYLHSVTNILDLLLPKGSVKYQIQDSKNTVKYYSETTVSRNYPIAVLTNKSSASASETLAISLKESYGADVLGTYSYGKGTVQTTKDLSSGGMIKYTIQKWLSPNGNWINEKGVEPTISVELNESYAQTRDHKDDNQLQTALQAVCKHK